MPPAALIPAESQHGDFRPWTLSLAREAVLQSWSPVLPRRRASPAHRCRAQPERLSDTELMSAGAPRAPHARGAPLVPTQTPDHTAEGLRPTEARPGFQAIPRDSATFPFSGRIQGPFFVLGTKAPFS